MIPKPQNIIGLIKKAVPVGLGMAFLFLGQAFLARLMGPDSFGSYSYLLTWITIAALLAKAGHEWVILKVVPGKRRADQPGEIRFLMTRVLKAVSIRATLAAAILIALAIVIGRDKGLTVGVIAAGSLLVVALAIAEIRRALALAYGAVWLAETPENIIKSAILVLIAVGMAMTGALSSSAMLWANLIVTLLSSTAAAMIFFYVQGSAIRSCPAISIEMKDHDDLMRSMWLTNFLNIILRNGDILIIGALTDFASTGIYIAATRIAYLAAAPVMVLDRIVAPQIAEAADLQDHARLSSSSWEYAVLSTAGCFALILFMAIWGSDFIAALFGSQYEGALLVTWILLIGHAANALTGPTGVLLSMTGGHRVLVTTAGIGAILYIILLYALTPKYLAIGAASAFAITHTTKALMQMFFVQKRLHLNPTIFRLSRASHNNHDG